MKESKLLLTFLTIVIGGMFTGSISWATWVTVNMNNITSSLDKIESNIKVIDWNKIPKKDLNKVFQ